MPTVLIKLVKAFYEIITSIIIVIITTPISPIIMALIGDAFTRYRFEISEFYRKTTEYGDISDLIIKVRINIYSIIVATNITYIYNQIIKHGMLKAF